jgi:hypothetical protein
MGVKVSCHYTTPSLPLWALPRRRRPARRIAPPRGPLKGGRPSRTDRHICRSLRGLPPPLYTWNAPAQGHSVPRTRVPSQGRPGRKQPYPLCFRHLPAPWRLTPSVSPEGYRRDQCQRVGGLFPSLVSLRSRRHPVTFHPPQSPSTKRPLFDSRRDVGDGPALAGRNRARPPTARGNRAHHGRRHLPRTGHLAFARKGDPRCVRPSCVPEAYHIAPPHHARSGPTRQVFDP